MKLAKKTHVSNSDSGMAGKFNELYKVVNFVVGKICRFNGIDTRVAKEQVVVVVSNVRNGFLKFSEATSV